ncbi:MAG TPA: FAD-dependent oxidoreductase [Candidatus Limnocylindria bacterium]|nr:FAD-dependent oxidoreductase [Candidatus Limnocylindria bacterium]
MRDLRTEICVIGAGISGLTTAYLAARAGRRVVVIDSGTIADGETARTTAHLTQVLDRRYVQLEALHGREGARLAAKSHSVAIERMEAIVRREHIRCGFKRVSAYLFVPPGRGHEELDHEFDAARRAGIRGLEWVDRAPLKSFDTGRCLRFPNQAQMDPIAYVRGLVDAIERAGGLVITHAHASEIKPGRPGHVVVRDGITIAADEIVVATNAPVHSRLKMHAKQTTFRTFAIGVNIPRGSVARALYYDTMTPYHYVRVRRPSRPEARTDLLIVGGEDHPTGLADDAAARWSALELWTRKRFPISRDLAYRWSGQVFEPHDGLACIGRDRGASHLYLVTGTSGSGMTYGLIAATILTDLWRARENPWADLYDPSRPIKKSKRPAGVPDADDEEEAEPRSTTSILRGEGAIVDTRGRKVAVYRNEKGMTHRLSAKCTHLGCTVTWNSAEKTWDCPCHGSRFDRNGRVVTGPAIDDLKPARSGRRRK